MSLFKVSQSCSFSHLLALNLREIVALIVFNTNLRQLFLACTQSFTQSLRVQSFDNLIMPLVESLKYITQLSLDTVAFVIISRLSNTDRGKWKVCEKKVHLMVVPCSSRLFLFLSIVLRFCPFLAIGQKLHLHAQFQAFILIPQDANVFSEFSVLLAFGISI